MDQQAHRAHLDRGVLRCLMLMPDLLGVTGRSWDLGFWLDDLDVAMQHSYVIIYYLLVLLGLRTSIIDE